MGEYEPIGFIKAEDIRVEIVRRVFKMGNQFLNKSRELGWKSFFQNFSYGFQSEVGVSFQYENPPRPHMKLQDIPDGTCRSAMKSVADVNPMNAKAWKKLLSESEPFIFITTYDVETKDKDGRKETREVVIRLNAMQVALKFLVAFTRCGSDEDLHSISKDSFRVIYMTAVLLREVMLMKVIESRSVFSRNEQMLNEADSQEQHNNSRRSRLGSLYSELLTEGQGESRGELPQQLSSNLKEKLVISVDMYNSVHDPPVRSGSHHEDNEDLSVVDCEDEIQTDQVEYDDDVVIVQDFYL